MIIDCLEIPLINGSKLFQLVKTEDSFIIKDYSDYEQIKKCLEIWEIENKNISETAYEEFLDKIFKKKLRRSIDELKFEFYYEKLQDIYNKGKLFLKKSIYYIY